MKFVEVLHHFPYKALLYMLRLVSLFRTKLVVTIPVKDKKHTTFSTLQQTHPPALGFTVKLLRFTNSGVTPRVTNIPSAFEKSLTGINWQRRKIPVEKFVA